MRTSKLTLNLGATALTLAAMTLAGNPALAAEYWLKAATTTVTVPNPAGSPPTIDVPMWGYASCPTNSYGTVVGEECTEVMVPGPALTLLPGDTGLTVHLKNTLSVPTSLVINGLFKPMSPVWTDGTSGPRGTDLSKRVRSFDAEAGSAGGEATYIWAGVPPGTYLYQSGTQPQVQVQMGLYGAMTATATAGEAYPGVAYNNQATLLYSEIDPAMHEVIGGATPTYGTTGPTSTIGYAPKYFLINGKVYPDVSLIISPTGSPGVTLLRLLNAGLTTHVPMIKGAQWTLVAEDARPYTYRRNQYTAMLTAAKTLDVLLTPDSGGATYAIMDRRLGLSNAGLPDGGMLAFLQYGAQGSLGGGGGTGVPPIANDDSYSSVVGVTLNVGAPQGVLINDDNTDGLPLPIKAVAASGTTAGGGAYTLNTNGSFSYTPLDGYAEPTDTFTYQVTDGQAWSAAPATVTINLSVPTAPPLSTIDDFNRVDATTLSDATHDWSQTVGTVTSAPDLRVSGNQATAVTTVSGGLAIWNVDFGPAGSTQYAGFSSATGLANSALVLKATGGTASAPANFVRVRCEGDQLVIDTLMGGSNISVFAKQATFGASGCSSSSGPLSAVVDGKGLVTTFLNGSYIGGVQLPDVPAWKGSGKIGVQLQTIGATIDDFSGGTIP